MKILLDTHALIWFLNGDKSLPASIKKVISDIDNTCYVSVASIWEIAIKQSLQKLEMKSSFDSLRELLLDNEIQILSIDFEHIQKLIKLPFDRLIIAQSITEKLTIISKDEEYKNYKVHILWK